MKNIVSFLFSALILFGVVSFLMFINDKHRSKFVSNAPVVFKPPEADINQIQAMTQILGAAITNVSNLHTAIDQRAQRAARVEAKIGEMLGFRAGAKIGYVVGMNHGTPEDVLDLIDAYQGDDTNAFDRVIARVTKQ